MPVSAAMPAPPKICIASSPDCTAASEIHSLLIATASSQRLPLSMQSPARYRSRRLVSSRSFMSTMRFETDWNAPICCLNCTRVRACSMHLSSWRSIAPT